MRRRLPVVALAAMAAVVVVSSVAWAYFSTAGAGSGTARVGVLDGPTGVTGTPAGASVVVAWTGVDVPPSGSVGYVVSRTPVPAGEAVDVCGTPVAPLPASAGSCTDSPVHAGTYTYAVTAVDRSWSSTGAPSGQVVIDRQAAATSLGLSSATVAYGAEAGVSFTATVTGETGIVPTGTVTIAGGGTTLCAVTLPATTCTADATALGASVTPHTVTATYGGDGEYTGTTSDPYDLTVTRDTTTTATSAVPDSVTTGAEDAAALTTTVTTGNGEPLPGSDEPVTIDVGGASCGATLVATTTGGTGTCSIGASALDQGGSPYAVTAAYPGDADLSGSASVSSTTLTVSDAPVIVTTALPDATIGQTSYDQVVEVGPTSPTVTWSVVDGTLPAGLAIDPATGEITGSVDLLATTETFTVQALDQAGASDSATLTLAVDPAPVVTTLTLAPARAAEAGYSQTLTATGGAGALTWSTAAGVLPGGLTLDPATGVISGNVHAGAGTETFTMTVTDANGIAGVITLTITVTPVFVQQLTVIRASGNHASFTAVLAKPVAAGDTLVLSLSQPCTTAVGTAVTSPVTGASWHAGAFTRAASTGCTAAGDAELWYLVGTGSASGTGATTVTVTLAAPATVPFLNVSEYTGVTGFDPAPGAASAASGGTTSVTPGPLRPSAPGDLVVSDAFVSTATLGTLATQLVPFVLLNQTTPGQGFGAYLVDPATSPLATTYVQAGPGAWSAVACAFTMSP